MRASSSAAAGRPPSGSRAEGDRRPPLRLRAVVAALLLRYGGLRAHQRALPFFLGLIVGDACISLVGTVLSHAVLGR